MECSSQIGMFLSNRNIPLEPVAGRLPGVPMPGGSALLAVLDGRAITLPILNRIPARLTAPGADHSLVGIGQVFNVLWHVLAWTVDRLDPTGCLRRLGNDWFGLDVTELLRVEMHGSHCWAGSDNRNRRRSR